MNKTVYKLRPCDDWRIGELESWYADMAAHGLHLKKMGIYFAKFVKGEPKKMRYRIDVSKKKEITPQQKQMYGESGWDYVTNYSFFHVFSSPEELDAPELHTDPTEQSYTLKVLNKKLISNSVILVVSMILYISLYTIMWFFDGTPTLSIVEGVNLTLTIVAVVIVYAVYNSLQAFISIYAMRRNLIEGRTIDHHAPWKKHHLLYLFSTFLFTILAVVSAIIPFVQLVKMETKTLPEPISLDLPIVRLADVENNPAMVRYEVFLEDDNVDWGNYYSYNWSPLAPIQYETNEYGVIPGETWKDGSGKYAPSIYTQAYRLTIPALSDNLISELIEKIQIR